MSQPHKYLVVGRQPWNFKHFETFFAGKNNWYFIDGSSELNLTSLRKINPRYIFFLHWSDFVPDEITQSYECVCFHMTDVPYGRGGSPLQNLIVRGHRETKLTALRMTSELDAGPFYFKSPLSLEGGTAEEIYQRASMISCKMAIQISKNEPPTHTQVGKIVNFSRRKPDASKIPYSTTDLQKVFDHIRMMDADGYPKAFMEIGNLRIEFSRVALYDGEIKADARIVVKKNKTKAP